MDFNLDESVKKELTKGLQEATLLLKRRIIEEISQSGTGNVYGNHTASSAGSPPSRDTGILANSIQSRVTDLEGEVGTNVDYAIYLEKGTKFMQPRPFLESTVEKNKDDINGIISDAIKKALGD